MYNGKLSFPFKENVKLSTDRKYLVGLAAIPNKNICTLILLIGLGKFTCNQWGCLPFFNLKNRKLEVWNTFYEIWSMVVCREKWYQNCSDPL